MVCGLKGRGIAHQGVGPARGEQIGLLEKVEELVLRPFGIGKTPVARRRPHHRRRFFAGQPLHRGGPQFEIGLAQPVLQLGGALRVGEPVFRDLTERFDHLGHFIGEFAVVAARFARLEIGRERPAAFLDKTRQIAREHLDVD